MDKVFHKYRTDSEFTESLITSGKVFLATAHQLNDPFECSLKDISGDWMNEQNKQSMQASLAGFALTAHRAIEGGGDFFGLRRSAIQKALDRVMSAGDLERSYDVWRAFILERTGHPPSDCRALLLTLDAQLTETGIFSMSSDPTQALMWAHYGDQHRGLCLGFRQAAGSKLADPEHCLPVIYSDALPEMDGKGLQVTMSMAMDTSGRGYTSSLKLSFTDKTFQRVVTTKPTCWSYEQEFRYIEPFGGLCDWPGTLAECTFGLRCGEDRRRHYIDLLETNVPNDVQLFEMRTKHGTNSMERVPLIPSLARSRRPNKLERSKNEESEELFIQEFAGRMQQLLQQERYGEVIYQTGENLKQHPSSAVLLHLKGIAHGRAHEHAIAYKHFRELAEKHPELAAGWYGMACALEEMGRVDEVVPMLRRAYEMDPKDSSVALNLGVHLTRTPETRAEGLTFLVRAEKLGHRRARRIIDQETSKGEDVRSSFTASVETVDSKDFFQKLFPDKECTDIFSEFGTWISLADCLAAARFIEGRAAPGDVPSRVLVVPFPDDQAYQDAFVRCLGWLRSGCRVPSAKIRAARMVDPTIASATVTKIADTTFHVRVDLGAAGTIEDLFPSFHAHRADRYLRISGDEHVIELIQNPLRCLSEIIRRTWDTGTNAMKLTEARLKTEGRASVLVHQPDSAGPLFALTEAVVFYSLGVFHIGPNALVDEGIELGYRSVQVIGRPPVDSHLFKVARQQAATKLRSLG